MVDYNTAYLVIELSDKYDNREGIFELRGAEEDADLERDLLVGPRGGLISQLSDVAPIVPQLGESGAEYAIDAGGGADIINVPVEITAEGDDPARWGDGSDVTRFDATGAHVYTRAQVLKWWIRNSRTGSGGPGKLHIGEWTDGRFGEAGAFDAPIDVQVMNFGYEWERDDPSAVTGSVTVRRIDSFPEFASDGIDTIGDVLDDLTG